MMERKPLKEYEKQLRPCPFCGEKKAMIWRKFSGEMYYKAMCGNSQCVVIPETPYDTDLEQVIENWNKGSERQGVSQINDTVKLIIEIPKELHEALLNGYEEPYSRMFSDVVKKGMLLDSERTDEYKTIAKRLSDLPSAFEGMTFGEIFKSVFAEYIGGVYVGKNYVEVAFNDIKTHISYFPNELWDCPYKEVR